MEKESNKNKKVKLKSGIFVKPKARGTKVYAIVTKKPLGHRALRASTEEAKETWDCPLFWMCKPFQVGQATNDNLFRNKEYNKTTFLVTNTKKRQPVSV